MIATYLIMQSSLKEMVDMKVIFYTTPAHGHINPALPIINSLTDRGYQVIAYSTEEFKNVIESSGAVFKKYESGGIAFDASIGSELIPLANLILKFSLYALPTLIKEAKEISPVLIMHDTLAFWGRAVAENINIPAFSVNTIQTVYGMNTNTFRMYSRNFALHTAGQIFQLGVTAKYGNSLKKLYHIKNTDMLSVLMNREKLNVFTFPRCMHPDGDTLGKDCFFLGATSRLRSGVKGDTLDSDNLIYVSLGTVFNKSTYFYKKLIKEFDGTHYRLLVSCGGNYEKLSEMHFPHNIVLTRFANQTAVLSRAKLFITAGGMNSLCEAAAAGVPCLIVSQQGEQAANAEMFEIAGGGFRSHGKLYEESNHIISTFQRNEKLIKTFSTVEMDKLMSVLEEYAK